MNRHPLEKITQEQIDTFRREGAVCIRNLLDQEWIAHMRAAVECALERAAESPNARNIAAEAGKAGRFHNESSLWQNHDGFLRFISESPLAEAAAILTGSKTIRLYNDHLLVKEPGTDAPTPWHQDGTYFRIRGDQVISAWVGLDPVRKETGAVGFVKGSHAQGRMYRPVAFASGKTRESDDFDGPMPDVEEQPETYETVFYDLDPGDVTFHHALTIHGSYGNTSTVRRRGYSVRMAGDDVRYADRPWTSYVIGDGLAEGARMDGHPDFPMLWPCAGQ